MHPPLRRRGAFVPAIPLLLLVVGCSALRFGGPSVPDLEGTWSGGVTVQGQRLSGTVALVQSGKELDAVFRAPSFDLVSRGAGEVDEAGAVELQLSYDLECPGVANLEGRVSDDGRRLSGTLRAADCTGTVTGTFAFTRS